MSCVPVGAATDFCANCGKEGSDTIKLKNCTACFLVKYCGVDCQKSHRKKHKKACKQRAAELKDEKLYGQGHERAEGDFCPICLLAIPFRMNMHSEFRACCMKKVCNGCGLAGEKRGLSRICPLCRSPPPKNEAEGLDMVMKRVAAKDPEAICHLGTIYNSGGYGLEKDQSHAIKLLYEAAELGSTEALTKIGVSYYRGSRGVPHDKAKGIHCWESAAMLGCADSRHFLGIAELEKMNPYRAMRHLLIAAKMGYEESLDAIKDLFSDGLATKAQYAEALKGYQDAVEETKSPEREEAANIGFSSTSNLVY